MKKITLCASLAALFAFSANSLADQGDSKVYLNGTIHTQNDEQPVAQAMVVKNGKFTYVGSNEEAKKQAGDKASVVDLSGKFVLPAFMDSHTHPGLIAATTSEDADGLALPNGSKEELFAYLEAIAKAQPDLPFLMLGEWDVRLFGTKGPDRRDLDKIFPTTPVMLLDSSGHSYWLNSAALAAAGITDETPDLKENLSFFVRDENGRMTGWVKEFALFPYLAEVLPTDLGHLNGALKNYLDFLVSKGVTVLMDAGTFDLEGPIYKVLSEMDKRGELPLRYEATHHMYRPDQLDTAVQTLLDFKKKYETENLKFNTLKIHFDGVTEINTAAVLEPFDNEPHNHGQTLYEKDELVKLLKAMIPHKINLHMHTVGDKSIRTALDAVEALQKETGEKLPIEVTLSHLEVVAPEDMKRFKELGVHANFTPHWFGGTQFKGGDVALGKERYEATQPANSFIDAGANVTFSSDIVIGQNAKRSNPFQGIQMGMTRQESNDGRDAKLFGKESERVSVADMVKGYTINNARQLDIENILGSIEKGKQADFVVIPKDLFKLDVYDIHKISPDKVYRAGKQVFPKK